MRTEPSPAVASLHRLERAAHLARAAEHWKNVGFERALAARDEAGMALAARAFRIAARLCASTYRGACRPESRDPVSPMLMGMANDLHDVADAFHDVCSAKSGRGEVCHLDAGHEGPHRTRIGDSEWIDDFGACTACVGGSAWPRRTMCRDCDESFWGDFSVGDIAIVTGADDDTADPKLIGERVRVVGMDGWMLCVRRVVGNREIGCVWPQELAKQWGEFR